MWFKDRLHAGRLLAAKLSAWANRGDVIVLALPRGGVPVAYEVARALGAALDILIVRKLGVPGHEELALGAIASGGIRFMNWDIVQEFNISARTIEKVVEKEQCELERRMRDYRADRPLPVIAGQAVIVIDDGIATGASMGAAVMAIRQQQPAEIVVAVPVASPSVYADFAGVVDKVIVVATPEPMGAVGLWYVDFAQTTDAEVRDLLQRAFESHLADHASG